LSKPSQEKISENLYGNLNSGEILKMSPFEKFLQFSLENARIDVDNYDYALWDEEDYCSPPL